MASSRRERVGLLMAEPAHGAGAALAEGLLNAGLPACVYSVGRAPIGGRNAPLQHLRQAVTTPRPYGGALCRAVLAHRWQPFGASIRIAAEARRDGVMHLHACDEVSSEVAQWAAGFAGIGFSMTLPASLEPRRQWTGVARRLRAARFVQVASEAAARAVFALAPEVDIRRAPAGVETSHLSPRLRRPSTRIPLVLAVAPEGAGEGIEAVIDACNRLTQQGYEVRCDVVCQRADVALAQVRVDAAGVSAGIRVLGPLGAHALVERLARAAVYLQLPQPGCSGGVCDIPSELLQAMAMALPVVAEQSPLLAECVDHGDNGWLIPKLDAPALADALRHLLTTPRLGEQLGAGARERVLDRFDAETNLRNVKAWLEQALLLRAQGRAATAFQRHRAAGMHHA